MPLIKHISLYHMTHQPSSDVNQARDHFTHWRDHTIANDYFCNIHETDQQKEVLRCILDIMLKRAWWRISLRWNWTDIGYRFRELLWPCDAAIYRGNNSPVGGPSNAESGPAQRRVKSARRRLMCVNLKRSLCPVRAARRGANKSSRITKKVPRIESTMPSNMIEPNTSYAITIRNVGSIYYPAHS